MIAVERIQICNNVTKKAKVWKKTSINTSLYEMHKLFVASLPRMKRSKERGYLPKMAGLSWINWCYLSIGIVFGVFGIADANWM